MPFQTWGAVRCCEQKLLPAEISSLIGMKGISLRMKGISLMMMVLPIGAFNYDLLDRHGHLDLDL